MQHFNLQPYVSPRDRVVPLSVHDKLAPNADAVDVAHEVVEYLMLMEQWLTGEIEHSDEVFKRLKFSLVRLEHSFFFFRYVHSISSSAVFKIHSPCPVTAKNTRTLMMSYCPLSSCS